MNLRLTIVAGLLILPATSHLHAQDLQQEDRAITFVKGTPVKDFDPALPKMRFERWLLDAVPARTNLLWELNDCGEQTGDPAIDSQRDIPICVETGGTLPDGRRFSIQVVIGTEKKPRLEKPAIRAIVIELNKRLAEVKRLRDLPKLLLPQPPPAK